MGRHSIPDADENRSTNRRTTISSRMSRRPGVSTARIARDEPPYPDSYSVPPYRSAGRLRRRLRRRLRLSTSTSRRSAPWGVRSPATSRARLPPAASIRRTTTLPTSRGAIRRPPQRRRARRPAATARLPASGPGGHRNEAGRRGVSIGVIAALVTVVVVVGAVILWRFFGDALSNRSQARRGACVRREVAVAVIADPSIADQIQHSAKQVQRVGRTGRRPLRQGRCQGRRLRRGRRRFRRQVARRTGRASRRCGFPGSSVSAARCRPRPARRRSATADRWSLPRWCSRSAPNSKRARPTELGHAAGAADQSDCAGRAEPAGWGRCGWRCR